MQCCLPRTSPASHHSRHRTVSGHGISRRSFELQSKRGRTCVVTSASTGNEGQTARQVYQGMFGTWSIEPADEFEVWSYRVGLTATVAAFVGAAVVCSSVGSTQPATGATGSDVLQALNPLCVLGAAGLGVSLVQIHIYVDPLKRALQVLWLLGVLGAVYVASQHPDQPLPLLIAQQPWTTWFVGPAAAAVTGVAIKEGLCYGKPEAAGLALLLPLLCLSHLGSDFTGPQLQAGLLAAVCGVGCVFAGRKYSQPVKDDIGDKSVFEFRKLPPQEQEKLMQKLQQQQAEGSVQ